MAKKASKKSRSSGSRGRSGGVMKKAARKAKKVVKKTAKKKGLTKGVVKKKVVKKLKEVGVAMARAAMDELMPANQAGAAGQGPQNGQTPRASRRKSAAASPR